MFNLKKNGVDTTYRTYTTNFRLLNKKNNVVLLCIDRLGIGEGEYSVAVMLAKGGYIDLDVNKFSSINPDVYYSGQNLYYIQVVASKATEKNTAYIAENNWSIASVDKQQLVSEVIES